MKLGTPTSGIGVRGVASSGQAAAGRMRRPTQSQTSARAAPVPSAKHRAIRGSKSSCS